LLQSHGRYDELVHQERDNEYGKITEIHEVVSDDENEYENM